jgi:hypothetical protein
MYCSSAWDPVWPGELAHEMEQHMDGEVLFVDKRRQWSGTGTTD